MKVIGREGNLQLIALVLTRKKWKNCGSADRDYYKNKDKKL